ncbi:WD40 repeat domain-containing protein [Aspergillus affinis]|uniref:WD40 repeat domain-containing protein n=1 Tax=Aspergillus affinis TaxID=1070780 RepID=UPI0022FE5264|nr:WD40 repeat-like protein [Aspergillus affinis]KAI9045011.1 WD40 repeat-like protein [Aspergillus affinis]
MARLLSEPVVSDPGSTALVTDLSVSPTYIIVSLDNSEIHVYDTQGNKKHVLKGSKGAVWSTAVQGDLLVSGGTESDIQTWNLSTGEPGPILKGHTSTVRVLRFLDGTQTLLSASRDATIRVWDAQTGECKKVLDGHSGTIRGLAVFPLGNAFVSAGSDGVAYLWSTKDFSRLHKLEGHEGAIYCAAVDSQGELVVTGGLDETVRIWRAENGECLEILHEPAGVVGRARILEDSTLITADSAGFVHVWSLYTPARLVSKLKAHEDPVAAFDVRGSSLVSAGGSILLSDIESGKTIATIDETAHTVWKLAFVEENKIVALVARDAKPMIEIWDISQGPKSS